jgi:uncharacterized membrane protein YjfL (UPF0719 family)
MIRIDQPYTNANAEDDASVTSFLIWAVIWIVVLLALFPR